MTNCLEMITYLKHFIEIIITEQICFLFSRSMWDALLKSVRCEIISFKRNDQIDAYVLR